MKRLTIRASRQRSTVRFGIEIYINISRKVFILLMDFWPVAVTVRYGKPPTEITNWQAYNAP